MDLVSKRKEEIIRQYGLQGAMQWYGVPCALYPEIDPATLLHAAVRNEFDLQGRVSLINASEVDLVLSLHLNADVSSPVTTINGVCGYTNEASAPWYGLFKRVIFRLSQKAAVSIYQDPNLQDLGEGLYLTPQFRLVRLCCKPILLVEGTFGVLSGLFDRSD